jgi:TnpA family transposase
MLRVAGSLTTGQVRAYDLIRMMQHEGRTTGLAKAFAHYGRIFKTLHLLQFIDDINYRRMIGNQLNISDEIKARISPLESGHITFHGRYTFRRPERPGALRPLRDPKTTGE